MAIEDEHWLKPDLEGTFLEVLEELEVGEDVELNHIVHLEIKGSDKGKVVRSLFVVCGNDNDGSVVFLTEELNTSGVFER